MSTEAQLKSDYADLGVTCGYIGNFERWGDDRRFMVFTNLRSPDRWVNGLGSVPGYSFSVDIEFEAGKRGEFDTPAVRARLDQARLDLAAGKLVRR